MPRPDAGRSVSPGQVVCNQGDARTPAPDRRLARSFPLQPTSLRNRAAQTSPERRRIDLAGCNCRRAKSCKPGRRLRPRANRRLALGVVKGDRQSLSSNFSMAATVPMIRGHQLAGSRLRGAEDLVRALSHRTERRSSAQGRSLHGIPVHVFFQRSAARQAELFDGANRPVATRPSP